MANFRGTHEVQECLEGQGEEDLHTYITSCKKKHVGLVPVPELNGTHFPGYRGQDLFNFTKVLVDITVKIDVNFTSQQRPEFVPGTKDPYPCYNTRGQNSLRTGTGRVWSVAKYTEGIDGYRTCPCPECDHSDTPCKAWWKVYVLTAKSVVFDSSEARQSSCRLWFDESEARQSSCRLWFDDDKSPVVKIYGWDVDGSDTERDWCWLSCVTHDVEIADKLEGMVGRFRPLCINVSEKYASGSEEDKLTIIVSHPHGGPKRVSVGGWVDREWVEGRGSRYTYTNSTCPGSTGALVYILGCEWTSNHLHSGANSGALSYSGFYKDLDLVLSAHT